MREPDPVRPVADAHLTRRTALAGGIVGLGAAVAALTGCSDATSKPRRATMPAQSRTGSSPARSPRSSSAPSPSTVTPSGETSTSSPLGRKVSGSFVSAKRGGLRTGWTIGYPPGTHSGALPVLIALHGKGGSHAAPFTELHLDRFVADAVHGGMPPFAVAGVDGGHGRYWHPRHQDDPAGMVIEEFLPLLAEHGLDTRRVGLFGWSMGGYGALYLASVLGRARTACAGAESPAIWRTYSEGVPGAFDDPADFAAHSIFARSPELAGIPIRIDSAISEPYAAPIADLRSKLRPPPAGRPVPGGHDVTLWLRQAPAQVAFAGAHLHR